MVMSGFSSVLELPVADADPPHPAAASIPAAVSIAPSVLPHRIFLSAVFADIWGGPDKVNTSGGFITTFTLGEMRQTQRTANRAR
jgi:hypothetical protein